MYSRDHHRRVAEVLTSLDTGVLEAVSCFFAGGTAIALTHGEYRESTDVDLMVSDVNGYRELRRLISQGEGLGSITRSPLTLSRPVLSDQYGIRTFVNVSGVPVKFEIIHEGRIDFDPPSLGQRVCGVLTLGSVDMVASKLMANDDRWADRSYHCRDLIDLAMLDANPDELDRGSSKVARPYPSAVRSLLRAIDHVLDTAGVLAGYMKALQMDDGLHDDLRARIEGLRALR